MMGERGGTMMTSRATATQRENATQQERNEAYEDAALLSVQESAAVLKCTEISALTQMRNHVFPVYTRDDGQSCFRYQDLRTFVEAQRKRRMEVMQEATDEAVRDLGAWTTPDVYLIDTHEM